MSVDQNHQSWGVEDFERYHSGKMNPAEMHALEKAAMEDPFLEDALDGYAYTKTATEDLGQLKEKLWPSPEAEPAPVVWFKTRAVSQLLKAAAILIIFGGLGWFIYQNNSSKQSDNTATEIASNKTSTPASDKPVFDLGKDSVPSVAVLDDQPAKTGMIEVNKNQATLPDNNYNTTPAEAEDLARNESRAKDKALFVNPAASPQKANETVMARDVEIVAKPSAEGSENSKAFLRRQQAGLNTQNELRGRVVDQNGQAVPYATVRNATDKRQAINADAQGNFSIQTNASNSNTIPVEINAVGYDSKQASLNNNSINTIVLNENEQKTGEEAVTSDYYSDKNKKKEKYQWNGKNSLIKLKNATPLEGWDYFYYVMNDSIVNNHYFNKDKGNIILQFDVDSAGNVKNIVVTKKLNDSVDNAAMMILLKSPVLKINDKKKKPEATIKFNY
ncbi:MAG: hypothetical protein EOO13_17845 [Chitinophagaceae bacterium]|nr:MAG: hypothetical protein EOO13_17845 [Chitinophagaceae bacterium]